jgi:SAM-dependent methyltransferase
MGLRGAASTRSGQASATVVWHELECGAYRADLELWRSLAATAPAGPILDVGAGTGRVSLELARAGRELVAVDRNDELLAALSARSGELNVKTVHGDARKLELGRRRFGLCIAAMQTIQLFGDSEGRIRFLERARAHMRPGGLIACAIVTHAEPYDCRADGLAPVPEWTVQGDLIYASRALRLEVAPRTIEIERERRIGPVPKDPVAPADPSAQEASTPTGRGGGDAPAPAAPRGGGAGQLSLAEAVWEALRESAASVERDLIVLDRFTVPELHEQARGLGLTAQPTLTVAPTPEHEGSQVVVLRA